MGRIGFPPRQGRGQSRRIECPECGEEYLVAAYISVNRQKKRRWEKIGVFCQECGYFERKEMDGNERNDKESETVR